MEKCEFCGFTIDSHYDYEVDTQGNVLGYGYLPCLDMVLGAVAISEIVRLSED